MPAPLRSRIIYLLGSIAYEANGWKSKALTPPWPSPLYRAGIRGLKSNPPPRRGVTFSALRTYLGMTGTFQEESQMPERGGLMTTAELAAIVDHPDLRLFDCTTYL